MSETGAPPVMQSSLGDAGVEAHAPGMSFAQERLWIVDKLVEDKALYNASMRFSLEGELDADAFHRALAVVVHRHDVLRTGFAAQDGGLLVADDVHFEHDYVDAGAAFDSDDALLAHQRSIAAAPFDLERPPLLRSVLYRMEDQRHEWLLTVHHIIFDGASIDVMLQELAQLYPATRLDTPPFLPNLPMRATDVALAERKRLSGDNRQRLLDAWKALLGDELPVLTLPSDRARPSVQSFRGATLKRDVPKELQQALENACRSERVTPFMLVCTVYAVWLCRHANQSEVVIGSPFALRGDKGATGLIGFFVNTVAMRIKVQPGVTFRQLLRTTRDLCLKTYAHGELPFAEVVSMSDPGRDLGHAPVFQAMLAVQNRRPPVQLSPNLRMSYLGELPIDKARFDVSMVMDFLPGGAELSLEYSVDLFDSATAEGMLDRFLILLDSALAEPEQAVDRLALLPDHERARLLSWSQFPVAIVPDTTVHALFEQAAAAKPEQIAVLYRDSAFTFQALEEQAETLADFLHTQGVRGGDLVGLCLPRSPDALVAVLAIWKAGAAYVPLDPEQPASRHAFIAQDAGLRYLLTHTSHRERFASAERTIWCLDDAALRQAITSSMARAPSMTDASALAYVIYTSGSTGEPKGVLVEHRAVSRLLGSPEALGYEPGIVMLQSVNAAFDASVLETWGPLCRGGRLVLYPGQGLDLSTLHGLIARYQINTLTLPATLLDMWVEQLEGPSGLERIVVGGEALSPATVKRLYALDDHVLVINHYGPTENGILSTYYPIPRDVVVPVPIGWAAPGTQLFVLNEAQQWQPAGAIGELYVAGQGLARGYLGRPDLNVEKFLPAGSEASSTHWYRTGDLVRWLPGDGRAVLQFVGRSDQQVKIRGFRIELGEIEAQLRACAGVQDAKVLVHRTQDGDRQIVGYVIAADGIDSRQTWRAQLQRELPAYMVPSALVLVPSWPLTQNGKMDAKALPAPDRDDYTRQAFAHASTSTEHALLAIWCDLLKLDRISIDDNFFDLGGHSLLATRLHNRIRASLQPDVSLRTVFEAQTIRQLAARLDALRDERIVDETPSLDAPSPWQPIVAIPDIGHAPLSYSQQRLWFIHHLDSDSAQYHIPYRLRLQGPLDVQALRSALRDLVARHAVLRTTFREIQGEPQQVVQPIGEVELPIHDVSAFTEPQRTQAAERRLRSEATQPFDLAREIPWRACLVRLSADEHWLALTVHHIAADGWSMGILERELGSLYVAHRENAPSSLPPLPVQYADYAHWQRTHLTEASLGSQLAYWQDRLKDIPLLHNLPLDRPRPAIQQYRGGVIRQMLPQHLVDGWRALVKQHDATLFMGLHAAFTVLQSRYSGETDIVVGTPVANRRDESLAPLMGLFINTLVLRTDLSGDPTFTDLLVRSREDALNAYEHQDVPFELLVERLNPPRHATYSPVLQVLFALQNNDMALPKLPGLAVSTIPLAERYAKFDVALNLQHQDEALLAEWEYDADLFDAETIEQMAASYRVLLEAILAAPHEQASRLPLLDDASRDLALALGNDTERAYDERDCLHALIERQAALAPDAIAVIHGSVALTYAQLDREANRLAHYLRTLGVKPDVPVAIAMDRDPLLVVALLATLKAGGAYVPLDASYPEARLTAMLTDSNPAVALTMGEAGARIRVALAASPELVHTQVIDMRDDAPAWSSQSEAALDGPDVGMNSQATAYIIYTSGSTGRPKGVMNEHRAIVNRLRWMQETYPLDARDKFLQTATIGFGASIVEIFWPLVAGAQLVLAEGEGHKDPAYLADVIQREGVTLLHFVPSMLQAFLDHPRARGCRMLARIFCGGEPMSGHLARRCRERLPGTRLYHLYGSSETAVLSTGWDCSHDAIPDNVPIGTPGANTRLYILDAHGEPVPRGVRGEIYVAGKQVARGYLNHDVLNAERFLIDPFHTGDGARMYRSGDLGRKLTDGSVEHLGRNDFQIKIRGQRVELGDIEAQILAYPGVRQAVVVAHNEDDGALKLVAYVMAEEMVSDPTLVAALRAHLQAQLPAHMVPTAFIAMPQFPLNANGKLDRQALPLPEMQMAASSIVPPETDLQLQLIDLWQDLVKHQPIGIECDFFAVGGHSLLVLRLANQLREIFGYELDMKAFFAAPNVRALAEDVHRHRQLQLAAQRFNEADASEIVEF